MFSIGNLLHTRLNTICITIMDKSKNIFGGKEVGSAPLFFIHYPSRSLSRFYSPSLLSFKTGDYLRQAHPTNLGVRCQCRARS